VAMASLIGQTASGGTEDRVLSSVGEAGVDRPQKAMVLPRMDPARLQEDSPQIGDALLCEQHLVVSLNHVSSSSTIPRFRKLLEV